jgi:hypothetical protein
MINGDEQTNKSWNFGTDFYRYKEMRVKRSCAEGDEACLDRKKLGMLSEADAWKWMSRWKWPIHYLVVRDRESGTGCGEIQISWHEFGVLSSGDIFGRKSPYGTKSEPSGYDEIRTDNRRRKNGADQN